MSAPGTEAQGRWIAVGSASDWKPGEIRVVQAEGRPLALGLRPEGFFAMDDRCPHAGASLGEGMIDGDFVICPLHAFAYDLRSGLCQEDVGIVQVFEVRQVDDTLEVLLGGDQADVEVRL